MIHRRAGLLAVAVAGVAALASCELVAPDGADAQWRPIFDGRTLDGWTPKIRGHELGVNYRDTFGVSEGALTVSYDKYDQFGERFGHIFYREPFSAYRLRLEYRFLTEGTPADTPGWAIANSGVMIFSQDPATMAVEQSFPVSVEAQFLGPAGDAPRTTGNMCSPGTHVVMAGKLETTHCINSTVPAPPNGEWVKFEVEVSPTGVVTQRVNGATAIVYSDVQLDPTGSMADGRPLIAAQGGRVELSGGYISLQSEGAPIQFRNIEVMELR